VMIGAAAGAALKPRWDRHRAIAAGIGCIGLLVVGVAAAGIPVALGVLAFLGGVCVAPVMVLQDTELQEAAPSRIRGRVASVRDILVNGAFVAAALAAALAAAGLNRVSAGEWHRPCLAAIGLCAAGVGAALFRSSAAGQRVT